MNASDTRNKADASAVKGIGGKLSNSLHVLSTNASLGGPGRKVASHQSCDIRVPSGFILELG